MSFELQYISDDSGEISGVVLPIEFWNKINCEEETEYLLQSNKNKSRLLESLNRDEFITKDEAYARIGI